MAQGHSGGCQCGAVRYRIEGALIEPEICHCRMCQKAHGAPAVTWATVERDNLAWTRGRPRQFASSDRATRGFCGQCGTVMTFERKGDHTLDIALATLDEPQHIAPGYQSGVESRMPWFPTIHLLHEERLEIHAHSYQHPDHDTETWPEKER